MRHAAFTLVELLVVITIIVTLLALLIPAMDQAIYQAELTVCGARLRAVAGSATGYAIAYRRAYPYRVGARDPDWSEANLIRNANPGSFGSNWDERQVLRGVLELGLLVCPLVKRVDLGTEGIDTLMVFSSYAIRFDWAFTGYERMSRVGDRWTYRNAGRDYRFSILAHDFATSARDDVEASWGTHPDSQGVLKNTALQDELIGLTAPIKATASRWDGPLRRGTVDNNYAREDGSVLRLDRLGWDPAGDERVTTVPEYDASSARPLWYSLVPAR